MVRIMGQHLAQEQDPGNRMNIFRNIGRDRNRTMGQGTLSMHMGMSMSHEQGCMIRDM